MAFADFLLVAWLVSACQSNLANKIYQGPAKRGRCKPLYVALQTSRLCLWGSLHVVVGVSSAARKPQWVNDAKPEARYLPPAQSPGKMSATPGHLAWGRSCNCRGRLSLRIREHDPSLLVGKSLWKDVLLSWKEKAVGTHSFHRPRYARSSSWNV